MPDTVREWELSESSLILSKVLTQRLYSLMHSTRDLTEGHFRDNLATLLDAKIWAIEEYQFSASF